MLSNRLSLVSWVRKIIHGGAASPPTYRRKVAFKPWAELFEDRLAPAYLGLLTPAAPGTFWPTSGHDDMRTGASTVTALITNPVISWAPAIPFASEGSPVVGLGPTGASAVTSSPAGGGVYDLDDFTGTQLGGSGYSSYFSRNSVESNAVIDSLGNVYATLSQSVIQKVSPGCTHLNACILCPGVLI